MTTSEAIDQLATALAQAQGEMGGAIKDSANPFFRSRYADLASVWDACRAPLAKYGLSVVQFPRTEYRGAAEPYEWQAKTSGETRYGVRVVTVVSVLTRILHSSGQYLEDEVSTMLPTADPQAVGSATTYLRRYALQSIVGVAPEDDDAEAAQGRGTGAQQKPAGRPMAVATVAPKGWGDWLDDMRSVADEGTEPLVAAWNKSPLEHRRHLMNTQPQLWESLKATAANVSAKHRPVTA